MQPFPLVVAICLVSLSLAHAQDAIVARVSLHPNGGEISTGIGSNLFYSPTRCSDDGLVYFGVAFDGVVTGDNNLLPDVYVRDPIASTTTWLSTSGGGGELKDITASGDKVLYETFPSPTVHALRLQTVSASAGIQFSLPTGHTVGVASLNAAGTRAAYALISGSSAQIRIHDFAATADIAVTPFVAFPNYVNLYQISNNGQQVLFRSPTLSGMPAGSHLYLYDYVGSTTQAIDILPSAQVATNAEFPFFLGDSPDVYYTDFATATVYRRDLAAQATYATDLPVTIRSASRNGKFAFCYASPNGPIERYVVATKQLTAIDVSPIGTPANGASNPSSVNNRGAIAFVSDADNLVAGDTNQAADVFVGFSPSIEAVDGASLNTSGIPLFVQPSTGSITTFSSVLLLPGTIRQGIAADGAAQLILRVTSPYPGLCTCSLPSSAPENGALAQPGSAYTPVAVQYQAVPTPEGWQSFILYRAPVDFVRPSVPADATAASRQVQLQRLFNCPQLGTSTAVPELTIRRPPVVLCHGLWSSRDTWAGPFLPLKNGTDPLFVSDAIDYSRSAGEGFDVNYRQCDLAIKRALGRLQLQGVACIQVDWVGHSMGGILPRYHYRQAMRRLTKRPWLRDDNFMLGDIHKLVLLNSPQWGSPWANVIEDLAGNSIWGSFVDRGLTAVGKPRHGAVKDLREGSFAYRYIGATPIPTRAITGTGCEVLMGVGTTLLSAVSHVPPPPWRQVITVLSKIGQSVNSVYRGHPHDFVVLEESQGAGLPDASIVNLFSPIGLTNHVNATGTSTYYTAVVNALNDPISLFSHLPAPNLSPSFAVTGPGLPPPPQVGGLSIQVLTASATPGGNIQVQVTGALGFVPVSCELFFLDGSMTATSFPATFTVPVPPSASGAFHLAAFGSDALGAKAIDDYSTPTSVPVSIAATLLSIEVSEPNLELYAPYQVAQLGVVGHYSDGIDRDLSDAQAGTTYSSSTSGIVSISLDGEVVVAGDGSTVVTVQNGPHAATCVVTVSYGSVRGYGFSAVGAGDYFPDLGTYGGGPTLGNANFGYSVSEVVGGSLGFLVQSLGPASGISIFGPVWVDPLSAVSLTLFANGSLGQPGAGVATYPYAIPNNGSLVGFRVFAQALFLDSSVPAGAVTSNGVLVTISQ